LRFFDGNNLYAPALYIGCRNMFKSDRRCSHPNGLLFRAAIGSKLPLRYIFWVTVTGHHVPVDTPTQTLPPQVFLHMTTHNFNDMVARSGMVFGTSPVEAAKALCDDCQTCIISL
jgi:hypothetical protein